MVIQPFNTLPGQQEVKFIKNQTICEVNDNQPSSIFSIYTKI